MKRLENRVAVVVGAGQTPGHTLGNGRAVAMQFAREGARVLAVDRTLESAAETCRIIREEGGQAEPWQTDITDEASIKAMVEHVMAKYDGIDILHNNVGVGSMGGDAPIASITSDAFDNIYAINLRGMAMTCKHVLPVMKAQKRGVIINISSVASRSIYTNIAYKATKAAVEAMTQNIAVAYAADGVRANCILPGLIETPMAIEARVGLLQMSREEVIASRDARVPLRGKMGSAWDIAYAAAFLASDHAAFITGVNLPVDGGATAWVGK